MGYSTPRATRWISKVELEIPCSVTHSNKPITVELEEGAVVKRVIDGSLCDGDKWHSVIGSNCKILSSRTSGSEFTRD